MTYSFLASSPMSIKLGVVHSLLSVIAITPPTALSFYVLLKYGRKNGIRCYLAVTLGQTCFLLMLFYGPYNLNAVWCLLEPYINIIGAICSFGVVYYLGANVKVQKWVPNLYWYFFGIMFTNPIRIGTFMPGILNTEIIQFANITYFIMYSLVYFCINSVIGIIVTDFLKKWYTFYRYQEELGKIGVGSIMATFIVIGAQYRISMIYWYPLRILNISQTLPKMIGNLFPEENRADIEKSYVNVLGYFKSNDDYNVLVRHNKPSLYAYEKHYSFIDNRILQSEEEEEVVEIEWKQENIDDIYYTAEFINKIDMLDLFVNLRLNLRTPNDLKMSYKPIPEGKGIPIGEKFDFKSFVLNKMNKKELMNRQISWIRTLKQSKIREDNHIDELTNRYTPSTESVSNLVKFELLNGVEDKFKNLDESIEEIKFIFKKQLLEKRKVEKTLSEDETKLLENLSDIFVKKHIIEPISVLIKEKRILDKTIRSYNKQVENRLRGGESLFSIIDPKEVSNRENHLSNLKKKLDDKIHKNEYLSLIEKEIRALFYENLVKFSDNDGLDYIKSKRKEEYKLSKYNRIDTKRLSEFLLLETGVSGVPIAKNILVSKRNEFNEEDKLNRRSNFKFNLDSFYNYGKKTSKEILSKRNLKTINKLKDLYIPINNSSQNSYNDICLGETEDVLKEIEVKYMTSFVQDIKSNFLFLFNPLNLEKITNPSFDDQVLENQLVSDKETKASEV